jgi:YggT family protein
MVAIGNLLKALTIIIRILAKCLIVLIIVKAILSWVNPSEVTIDPTQRFISDTLDQLLDPLLEPIRVMLPITRTLGIDVSPVVAILTIWFFDLFILSTIQQYAARLTSTHA